MVIFRPKDTACVTDVEQWLVNQMNLLETWMTTVLVPAVDSLPQDSRTRLNNAFHTCLSTGVLPKYVRIYREDVEELDSNLPRTTTLSPLDEQLSWFFVFVCLGQRHQLQPGEELGPQSFGLEEEFDLRRTLRFSVHLAMNFSNVDPAFFLFWNHQELRRWCQGELLYTFNDATNCILNFCMFYVQDDHVWFCRSLACQSLGMCLPQAPRAPTSSMLSVVPDSRMYSCTH